VKESCHRVVIASLGFGTSRGLDWWNFNVNTAISSTDKSVPFHIALVKPRRKSGRTLHGGTDPQHDRLRHVHEDHNAGPKFQAGSFVLNTKMSLAQIVNALQHGRADQKTITFKEGYPLREYAIVRRRKVLAPRPNIWWLRRTRRGSPAIPSCLRKRATRMRPTKVSLSRHVLIDPKAGVRGLIKAQLDQFGIVFSADLRRRSPRTRPRGGSDDPIHRRLASMVDREANAITASDRGNVCSVYYNRLKIKMTLGWTPRSSMRSSGLRRNHRRGAGAEQPV